MYTDKKHSIKKRIISLAKPYIRPSVREKAKASVEFGAKLTVSVVMDIHLWSALILTTIVMVVN